MKYQESNVERLEHAGVLDSSEMSKDHIDIVNNEMTEFEILALMVAHRAKSRMNPAPWKPDVSAEFF